MGDPGFAAGSREELARLQLDRLRRALRHAYDQVPYYRSKFDAARVAPADLVALADLARFPFTTKQDLRANYPFGMFAVPMDRIVRIHASSGTTGKPTVVGYTRADLDLWAEIMARGLAAAGVRADDLVHNALGYGLFTGGLGIHDGAERLGAAVVPVSGGQTERQVQLINDFRPTVIAATPSYLLAIGDEFERQGLDPRASSLRIAILGAEPWTNEMRREIEARFGLDAIECYGLSEVIGPGVAMESRATKDGPHIWEDHFYPEIVDPATGRVLPDGEFGELVLTSLTKEALPVIRYRTRDLTRLLPGTAHPALRRMAKIAGRSDDMLIVRGVNVFPSQIEELVLRAPNLAPHYRIEVTRPRHLDELTVCVEPKAQFAEAGGAAWSRAARELEHHIKSSLGLSAQVAVLPPGAIERSAGKAQRVIDRRPRPG
jgi:phenylacetate-CoA ligase